MIYWKQQDDSTIPARGDNEFAGRTCQSAPVPGFVIPVCRYNHKLELEEICLYPAKSKDGSLLYKGIPGLVCGEEGTKILSYLSELSRPYKTKIEQVDGRGVITLGVS